MKRILIIIGSLIGGGILLVAFLIAFTLFVGIPTFQDNYVEIETQKSELSLLDNELVDVKIEFMPEVLERLIVPVTFNKKSEELILKDFSIELFDMKSKQELERIFKIRVFKPDFERPGFNDEISLEKGFNEIDLESKYRDLSYTVQPQFDLGNCEVFEASIKLSLLDTLSNKIISIDKKMLIQNKPFFKIERFGFH